MSKMHLALYFSYQGQLVEIVGFTDDLRWCLVNVTGTLDTFLIPANHTL